MPELQGWVALADWSLYSSFQLPPQHADPVLLLGLQPVHMLFGQYPILPSFEEGRGKIKLSEDAQLTCGTLILAAPQCYSHSALGNVLFWFNTSSFELVLTLVLVGWNS